MLCPSLEDYGKTSEYYGEINPGKVGLTRLITAIDEEFIPSKNSLIISNGGL